MGNRSSITILQSTGSTMNQYSDDVEGDSYYAMADGLHTLQVSYDDFIGRLRVQATLVLAPGSTDWFDILPETTMGTEFNSAGYIQFNSNSPGNVSEAYTFRGNFTYLRCYMDRTYVGNGTTYDSSYGQIERIIFSA